MSELVTRNSLSFAAPWDVDFESNRYMLDDVTDDCFLLQFKTEGASDTSDITLGLSDESESDHQEELPSFYGDHEETPPPSVEFRRVTPDSSESSEVSSESIRESPKCIKKQYRHSFKKLAKSMRQSDATRSMIKKQKRLLKDCENEENFFSSRRCTELEAAREKLFKVLANNK